jgi:hypothetical protein
VQYLICGFSVATDIILPGAWPVQRESTPDITLRLGVVPHFPGRSGHDGRLWSVQGDDFLLSIPGLVRFLVRAGREIIVEPAPGIGVDETVPFMLSTGFAALLHQRSVFALHAATVVWQGRAIALCGPTGIGKSTMAAALCGAGAQFVGDDIAAIHPGNDGRPLVYPDGRQHRLWADAVAHLGMADRQERPVRTRLRKFHVAPSQETESGPVPLSTVVLFEDRPDRAPPAPPAIIDLPLVDALPLLRGQIYRPGLAERMGHGGRLFTQSAQLLSHVRVLLQVRTRTLTDLRAGAKLLLSAIMEGG